MKKSFLIYKKLFNTLRGTGISKVPGIKSTIFFMNKKLKPEYIEFFGNKVYLNDYDHSLNLLENENDEIKFFQKYIKQGDNVIDIGANIGRYTLIFAKIVGNKGKIFAFEPGNDNYKILKKEYYC